MKENCCIDRSTDNHLKLTVEFLKIIAEENRLKILCILLNNDEKCVCDIWQYINIPQNLTSHHLKVLKNFGLIKSRKEGLNVFYSIDQNNLTKFKKLVDTFLTGKGSVCF
jgi:DNA-binding transcriptional ArsR family regulator